MGDKNARIKIASMNGSISPRRHEFDRRLLAEANHVSLKTVIDEAMRQYRGRGTLQFQLPAASDPVSSVALHANKPAAKSVFASPARKSHIIILILLRATRVPTLDSTPTRPSPATLTPAAIACSAVMTVFFLTGTDEHGQKIKRAAQAAGRLRSSSRIRFRNVYIAAG